MSRRSTVTAAWLVALILAFAALAAGCGGEDDDEAEPAQAGNQAEPEAERATVRIRFNWVPGVDFLGWYAAEEQGYYEDENIDFQFEAGGPNVPPPTQALAGGAADIGIGNLYAVLKGRDGGEDFVAFGAKFQEAPLGMLSLPDNPIRTAEQICGKKILAGQSDVPFLEGLLVANGLEPDCFELVPGGFDPAPVVEGQADGMVIFVTSQPISLQNRGVEHEAVTFAEMGQPQYADMLFAKRDWIEQNHDALARWMRATIKGWEWARQNPQEAIDLMMNEYGGLDAGNVEEDQMPQWEATEPLLESELTAEKGLFWMDPALVEGDMYEALGETDIKDFPPVEEVIDVSILEEAYGDKTCFLEAAC